MEEPSAVRRPDHLCGPCRSIFARADVIEHLPAASLARSWPLPIGKPTYPHHTSRSTLRESANEKCYICVRLWERMYPDKSKVVLVGEPADPKRQVNITYCLTTYSPEDLKEISIWFIEGDRLELDQLRLLGRYVARPAKEILPHVGKALAIPKITNMPRIIPFMRGLYICRLARTWLASCREKHQHCHSQTTDAELPTRLVAVDRSGDKRELSVNLCEGKLLPAGTEYVSLSHCWGRTPFFTLTQARLEELKQAIPVLELPQLFQDALLVTYELGFRYIWIDSLCIIQDSSDDWAVESAAMDRVYLNGVCNLAGTAYLNGQEGLFRVSGPSEIIPPAIDCSKFRPHDPEYALLSSFDWRDEVLRAPLNTRAWVCQEQIMAPRTLHFGRRQIYWECYNGALCETFPIGAPFFNPTSVKQQVRRPIWKYNELGPDELYSLWKKFVAEYTARDLTFKTDKLPAISGIAKVFMRLLNDIYVAGLWKKDIYRGLLWYATGSAEEALPYRAPSWSWASINGHVSFYALGSGRHWEGRAMVHQVRVTNTQSDSCGQVADGSIRITGRLLRLRLQDVPWDEFGGLRFRRRWDLAVDDPLNVIFSGVEKTVKGLPIDLEIYRSSSALQQRKEELFIMPLMSHASGEKDSLGVRGLVLSPHGETAGRYKKVGIYETFRPSEADMFWLRGYPRPIEPRYYENFAGLGGYTISID